MQHDENTQAIRILLAVGNPERERQLLGVLSEAGMAIAGRALDGPSLAQRAAETGVDVAVASTNLHRLGRDTLMAVREARVPLVLLVGADEAPKYEGLAYLLPDRADGSQVVAAIEEASRRGAVAHTTPRNGLSSTEAEDDESRAGPEVVTLVSGKGAPGTTTVAIGLAAALTKAGKKVLLVDGDLRGGAIGPYLDLDPRRGLVGLTAITGDGSVNLATELQDGPGFPVLVGLERPEMGERLQFARIAPALQGVGRGFDAVLIDAGETIAGRASQAQNALVRLADRVFAVTTADLLGLWNTRACLRYVHESIGAPARSVSLVINRHTGRDLYGASEVERALGAAVLAVIPEEQKAARRAVTENVPITAFSGAAARELRALSLRLAALAGPVERELVGSQVGRRWWRRTVEAGN